MLIPLDYYRILGLPIQANAEQLQQAHRDRTLQLPRREYSEVAIASRKQLIDEAFAVLANPEQRQAYDATFLASSALPELNQTDSPEATEPDGDVAKDDDLDLDLGVSTTGIEITDSQYVGAILILHELGEYELVLRQTFPYLSKGAATIKDGRFGDAQLVLPDLVLTVGLACLELGREKWQQGQYEDAGESLETGQDLLLRHNLFVSIRGEIQSDLFKLRPYRILELLALPESQIAQRKRGLQLLNNMLQERGGIDGQGDDRSGLNMEDFLRFMQQLRTHLTTTEQQTLFETEARRPSAVATYLMVYTLIATGFSQRQPILIRRAKLMLLQLGRRQDVNLEKAVCALLLGQTEEASRALELSQEQEPLSFIRENSENSSDLLPGLCFYTERWLSEEVFPHFRDLIDQSAVLKDYFADAQVESYLEGLPNDHEASNEWVTSRRNMVAGIPSPVSGVGTAATVAAVGAVGATAAIATNTLNQSNSETSSTNDEDKQVSINNHVTTGEIGINRHSSRPSSGERKNRRRGSNHKLLAFLENLPPKLRLVLLGLILLLLLWILWSLLSAIGQLFDRGPKLQGEHAFVTLDKPPVEIPPAPPPPSPTPTSTELNPEVAQQAIESWLSVKAVALGQNYELDKLSEILVDPALTRWRQMGENFKREGVYRTYQHAVKINQIVPRGQNKDQGTAEAEVREVTKFFDRGKLTNSEDTLVKVRYDLVKQDDRWFLRDWEITRSN